MNDIIEPRSHELPFAACGDEIARHAAPTFQLKRGPFDDRPDVWRLDILRGNPFRLAHAQADDDTVSLALDAPEQLDKELSIRRERPRRVLLGLSADPLPPRPEVQIDVGWIVAVLARHGISTWLATRGTVLPELSSVLEKERRHVRVAVPLLTLDREIEAAVEALAPSSERRLEQVAEFRRLQIPVEVSLDPLLPGLTDTRESLQPLLERLADLGIDRITAGYLVLRPGVKERMRAALDPAGWSELVLSAYVDAPICRDDLGVPLQLLRKSKRMRGYASLIALASRYGIAVRLGSLSNPDFAPPRRPDAASAARARSLLRSARESAVLAVGA